MLVITRDPQGGDAVAARFLALARRNAATDHPSDQTTEQPDEVDVP